MSQTLKTGFLGLWPIYSITFEELMDVLDLPEIQKKVLD